MNIRMLVDTLLESDDVNPKAFVQAHNQVLAEPSREHLMVSSTDGGLYDTRNKNWHSAPPLRSNYERFHPRINNVAEFKATWRARHSSNYPLAFILSDGGVLCEKCAEDNLRRIIDSIRTRSHDGWRVEGVSQCHGGGDEEQEDYDTQCSHCNKNLGELA